ncbi:MAG: hypothetical protein IH934_05335 [Nanoarchaeota archaeon]|nr:hypothetical protein [Nanoarchaeota archaeon]
MSTINNYSKKIILILVFLIINLYNVIGHLEGGKDKAVNGYLIDFGYDPKNPIANEKTVIVISLFNETTNEVIEPTSMWIRVSSTEDVIFAGTFKPENQNVAFSFTFPHGDVFEITTRFFEDENLIVETDFDINVKGKTYYSKIIILFLSLILLVIVLKSILFKPKKV